MEEAVRLLSRSITGPHQSWTFQRLQHPVWLLQLWMKVAVYVIQGRAKFTAFFGGVYYSDPHRGLGDLEDKQADLSLFIFSCVRTVFLESAQQLRLWKIFCKLANRRRDVTLGVVSRVWSGSPCHQQLVSLFLLEHAQICTCKSRLSAEGQRFYESALLMSLPWINKQVWTEFFHSTDLTGPSCSIQQGHC